MATTAKDGAQTFSIPSTMKAVVVRELGNADVLRCETDFPTPSTLSAGHVLVKNKFAGLNFIDTYFRKGLYQQELPFVCGQEGGGVIVQVSQKDDDNSSNSSFRWTVGQRVVYLALGSYAEYTAVPCDRLIAVPDAVPLDVAVATTCQGLTAHYLVTDAHAGLLQTTDWCLIYSVGSGTGQWAAQMAKRQRGYRVIGTTSAGKADAVRATGCCDELIVLGPVPGKSYADYTSVDIAQRVNEITNGVGAKCILDGVGMATFEISLACLATRGIWVTFGNASGAVPPFPLLRLAAKSAFVTRPKLNDYVADPNELKRRSEDVFSWLQSGTLDVTIDKTFTLEQAAEGHKYLESGQSKGKILYKVS